MVLDEWCLHVDDLLGLSELEFVLGWRVGHIRIECVSTLWWHKVGHLVAHVLSTLYNRVLRRMLLLVDNLGS